MSVNTVKKRTITLETIAGHLPPDSYVPAPDIPVQENKVIVGTLTDNEKLFLTLSENARESATALSKMLNATSRKTTRDEKRSREKTPGNNRTWEKFVRQSEICNLFGGLLWSSIRERIPFILKIGAAEIRKDYKIITPTLPVARREE